MYLCMDAVKFLLEALGASILRGCYNFVTTCRYLGALLLGRALLIGTLRYLKSVDAI